MKIHSQVHLGLLGVKFDLKVKRAGSKIFEHHSSGHNLILDVGLDMWGVNHSGALTEYCAVGSGTNPVERDSSTTTASRSGTTVTADGSFFEAGDVGRLIKWDSGEEDYIQTYTSPTEIETQGSGAIASDQFTIYYVDDTGLQTELRRVNTYRTETGDNQTTESAGVITHKRTFLFSAEASPVTYNEIGWSANSSGNLFNRALISGGVALGTGDQLLVVANLEIVQSPQTAIAQSNVGTGFDTSGQCQIEGYGMAAIQSNGTCGDEAYNNSMDASGKALEPKTGNQFTVRTVKVSETDTPFATYGTIKTFTDAKGAYKNYSEPGYSNGNYYRDKTVTFATTEAILSNITTIAIGVRSSTFNSAFRIRLTSTFGKTNSQTLFFRFRVSWGRVLTNS